MKTNMKKIHGIQMWASNFDYVAKGKTKEVIYTRSFDEMTVDTDQGSWIINRDDLLSYLNNRKI